MPDQSFFLKIKKMAASDNVLSDFQRRNTSLLFKKNLFFFKKRNFTRQLFFILKNGA